MCNTPLPRRIWFVVKVDFQQVEGLLCLCISHYAKNGNTNIQNSLDS